MKPWRASMIVAGLWAAGALTSCGVGGEEQARESVPAPAVASVSPWSVTPGNTPALATSQYPTVVSTVDQSTENADSESADATDPDGDEEEAAALFILNRQ